MQPGRGQNKTQSLQWRAIRDNNTMSRGPASQSEARSRDSDQSKTWTSVPSPGAVTATNGTSLGRSYQAARQTHNNQARKQCHCQAQGHTFSSLTSQKELKQQLSLSLDIGYLCWKRANGIFHWEIFKSFLVEDSGIMLQEELIWQFASKGWRFWGFESS